jgi:hypothetical protein
MRSVLLILSSFVLAFCGVVYELALAQTNSVLLGNSYLQYGLTIGLFMAGLGAGSLRENRESPAPPRDTCCCGRRRLFFRQQCFGCRPAF